MNIHIDTDFQFPEDCTEGDKLLAIVEFWMQFRPEVRKLFIEQHDDRSSMFDHADGAIMAILNGLQQVDMEKLKNEIAAAKEGNDISKGIQMTAKRFGLKLPGAK